MTPEEIALEVGYALATADAAAWFEARGEYAAAEALRAYQHVDAAEPSTLPLHRTEAGWPNCSTCDGGGCRDCTDRADRW